MAAAQTVAVVEAGGRTVSLGDLLGPEFYERPHEMFSSDRFHPSPAGYARAAAALLPSVCAALGIWVGEPEPAPDRRRGEGGQDAPQVHPVGTEPVHPASGRGGAEHAARPDQGQQPHGLGAHAVAGSGDEQGQRGPGRAEPAEEGDLEEHGAP